METDLQLVPVKVGVVVSLMELVAYTGAPDQKQVPCLSPGHVAAPRTRRALGGLDGACAHTQRHRPRECTIHRPACGIARQASWRGAWCPTLWADPDLAAPASVAAPARSGDAQ